MTWETGKRLTYIFKLRAVNAHTARECLTRNSPRHRQSRSSYHTALLPPQRIQASHPGVGCLPIAHWLTLTYSGIQMFERKKLCSAGSHRWRSPG